MKLFLATALALLGAIGCGSGGDDDIGESAGGGSGTGSGGSGGASGATTVPGTCDEATLGDVVEPAARTTIVVRNLHGADVSVRDECYVGETDDIRVEPRSTTDLYSTYPCSAAIEGVCPSLPGADCFGGAPVVIPAGGEHDEPWQGDVLEYLPLPSSCGVDDCDVGFAFRTTECSRIAAHVTGPVHVEIHYTVDGEADERVVAADFEAPTDRVEIDLGP
jgi:hypothetical protein